MRYSQTFIPTLKETPADADVASHRLLLRAGYMRQLGSGIYSYLPLLKRVLHKVETIVREEMAAIGAQEFFLPALNPKEVWEASGRWSVMGPNMFRLKDRKGADLCLGMTHEEVFTAIARDELRSYRQLPQIWYQIQTKFRDEIRPRFGVMRAREFLMKDAYSFHLEQTSLQETYDLMHRTYSRIFSRCGLDFRAVAADTGSIGGSASHEFHVLADSGEDAIAFSSASDYAANVELAEALPATSERPAPSQAMRLADTPNVRTIQELVEQFQQPIEQTVKTLVVAAAEEMDFDLVALLVRGDHELNAIKAEKLPQVASPLRFADETEIRAAVGAGPGSLGPVNLTIPVIADRSVAVMADFSAGANQDGKHLFGINWERDLPLPAVADIRNVREGDPSPDGQGTLTIARGIEVGHIFQLGKKYSEAMKASVLDEQGRAVTMTMGCYGIGVSRVVAAAVEQNNDGQGILWPAALAPFHVALVPMKLYKSHRVREAAEALQAELEAAGIEVLLDDRDTRPGISFADMELIGIPHRLVIGEKGLDDGMIEYRGRRDTENRFIERDRILDFLKDQLQEAMG